MHTIEEAVKVVKSLFSAPIGSFPRGGIETALNVHLNTSPTFIKITTEHGLEITLKKKNDLWTVLFLDELKTFKALDEALYYVVEPIIHDEISHRLSFFKECSADNS